MMSSEKMIHSSKVIDRILKVLQGIVLVCAVLTVFFAAVSLITGEDLITDADSLSLGYLIVNLADTAAGSAVTGVSPSRWMLTGIMLMGALALGIAWYGMKILRDILSPMKEGRPFEQGISGPIRRLGWISLIGGAVTQVIKAADCICELRLYDLQALFNPEAVSGYSFNYSIDLNFIVLAVVLFLLSLVFRYGEGLQKESDETL